MLLNIIKKRFSLIFIGILLQIIPFAVFAGEETSVDLGEVLVQTEAEPKLDETAAATVIIPERDVPLANTTVQLLEQSAGVHVKRFGGIDDFSALSLRGSTPSQVQIYMDDVPLVTAQGTLTDLSIIPMDAISRVEVYRGGSPGTLAESSIGGVVVLVSKDKPEEFEWKVNGGYGSFETLRLGVTQAQPLGKFSYRFAYDHFRSKGDFVYMDNNGTTFNPNDDRELRRQNNAFAQNALFTKMTYDFPQDWRLEFVDSFLNKQQGVPGLGSRKSLNAHLTTWRNVAAINLDKNKLFVDDLEGRLNLFFDFLNSKFDDPQGEIGLGPQANDDDTYRFGEMLKLVYGWGRHQIITGMVSHRGEYYVPYAALGSMTAGSRSNRHSISAGVEDEVRLWGERLHIVPSVRLENTFNDLQDAGVGRGNDSSEHQLSAKLGLKFRLIEGLYLKGNVYRGFRQPTFTELFGDRGALVGNPDLKPEEAFNFDVGLVYRLPETSWLNAGSVEAAYFQSDVDNLIQFLQTSQFTAKAQNLNDALIRGVEMSARSTFFDRFSLAINYTWQRARDTSGTVTDGKFLPGRPQHELGAMFIWREQWDEDFASSLIGELHYASDNYLDTQNLLLVKDRTIVTAGISFDILKHVTASFTARNITNDQTVDAIGYPLPGRSYWGNLEVKL